MNSLEIEIVNVKLTELISQIEERIRLSVDSKFVTEIGSTTYFMTQEEKEIVHRLKLSLPTFAEEREAAKQRIKTRLRLRKLDRKNHETQHN